MNPHILQPRMALNKAYLKVKPVRGDRLVYELTEEEVRIVEGGEK